MRDLLFTIFFLCLCFWHYGTHFIATIFVISFLIFFHELGHFLVARFFKVKILTFSIGFGKALFYKDYKGTRYQLSSIFLGGYVKMKGQDDLKPLEKDYDTDSYTNLHPLKKIAILFAGPFFNFILAFLLYISLAHMGVEKFAPIVGYVNPNAEQNIKVNDVILEVNSHKINSFEEISALVQKGLNNILVKRDDEIINITMNTYLGDSVDEFGQNIKKSLLGIAPKGEFVKVYHSGISSIPWAFNECLNNSLMIYEGLKRLILAKISPDNISGIITMGDITTKAASLGIATLFSIAALISINLGVLNLLPIPVLDGGHIVFNIYELIFKKPVNDKAMAYLSYLGMSLLLFLMLFATYNDINRLFLTAN